MGTYSPKPYQIDLKQWPSIVVTPPGPKSKALHTRCCRHFKGLSGQVKLFPVAFEEGSGCTLTDVDGNRYIDFSSGIYVTTLGHCHPKISQAVQRYAGKLMNCHDFTTDIKTRLVEKMAQCLPGISRATSSTIGRRRSGRPARLPCGLRASTSSSVASMISTARPTAAGVAGGDPLSVYGPTRALLASHMVPRLNPHRPQWTKADGSIGNHIVPRVR